jgi:haloacetate dehalogenase
VALRTALDHPDRVTHLVAMDAVPLGEALARADARFATLWWHWFFYAQPDKPERAILADPEAWYRSDRQRMAAENRADYLRAIHDPETVHAMLEDYRAGLGPDRADDEADRKAGRRVDRPTLVVWASEDDLPTLYGDPLDPWTAWCTALEGVSLDCGHHMAEERPVELATLIADFLERPTATRS